MDISFKHIYQQSVQIAEGVSTTPEMPRVTGRQQHCSNPSSFSVEDYFKKTVAIPLLDHIITSIKDRFTKQLLWHHPCWELYHLCAVQEKLIWKEPLKVQG